jgi:hypothetical protein
MGAVDYVDYLDGFRRANLPWVEFWGKIWARSGGESDVVKAALELVGWPRSSNPDARRGDVEREELRARLQRSGVPNVQEMRD